MTREPRVPDLLTATETANALGLTVKTLYQWRLHAKGPVSQRVGGRLRYRAVDVARYIQDEHTAEVRRRWTA